MNCDCILHGLKMERICDVHLGLMREVADRERAACAETAEHFTGNLWDADENALAQRIVKAIRERKNNF